MKPTIYDVARVAGVSISTVSLVMNKPERVSATSRAKVLAAVDDLGYVPKSDAVSRARRGIGRIGVVAPFSSYSSFAERLCGVFEELSRRARTAEVVTIDHESAAVSESPLLESLPLVSSVDGLIVMGITPSPASVERFRQQNMPVVIVGVDEFLDLPTVSIAESAGGRLAADQLHRRNPERYLYLGERQVSDAYLSQSQLREAGFRGRLLELGVPADHIDVRTVANNFDASASAAAEYLADVSGTIGIFAYCDLMAAGALHVVRNAGRSIPADVSVVGFDGGDLARALSLTTITQPLREEGRAAVHLLLQALEGHMSTTASMRLPVKLVNGDT